MHFIETYTDDQQRLIFAGTKILLLFLTAASVHRSLSPPNPSVKSEECCSGTAGTDTLFERVVQSITYCSKVSSCITSDCINGSYMSAFVVHGLAGSSLRHCVYHCPSVPHFGEDERPWVDRTRRRQFERAYSCDDARRRVACDVRSRSANMVRNSVLSLRAQPVLNLKLSWQVFQYAWPVLHLRDYNPTKAPPYYSRAVRVGPPPKLHGRLSHPDGGDARARRAWVVDGCVRSTHCPWRAGRGVLGGEVYFCVQRYGRPVARGGRGAAGHVWRAVGGLCFARAQ